ncbi:hypothetical protein ACWCSD_42340 [Nonomuraea sp. NPDC001684]
MTTEHTTEAGDEPVRIGRAMLRAYARQTGRPVSSLLTPYGRAQAAEQLLGDLLDALADDNHDVPTFLANALADTWGEEESEPSPPFIAYRSPSWMRALGRAAIDLYGTYGDRRSVLTDYETHVVNDAAQLLADVDEHGMPGSPMLDLTALGTAAAILWDLHGDDNGVLTPDQKTALDQAMALYTRGGSSNLC